MNINSIKSFVEKTWDTQILPSLMEYITIPAVSPEFAPDWEKQGYLNDTLELAANWCRAMALENTEIRVISTRKRTPALLIEIDATGPDHDTTTLLYGHLDKQPESSGWDKNKGPWTPVIENNRLYGRGGADDGYAVFSAVTAVKALQTCGIPHGRCVILVETCEESGSRDLAYYLETCKDTIGTPDLIICLDSGCRDYKRLWITTSLRGIITGELEARILKQNIHSGASGMVASSFRILRQLLDRVEDARTGELLIPEFYTHTPEKRKEQIRLTAQIIGKELISALPLLHGAVPTDTDPRALIINSTWKPAVSYIGADGIPPVESAAGTIRESTKLVLSIRTPPTTDTRLPAEKLKTILEQDPPYGAAVTFKLRDCSAGWDMPDMGQTMETAVQKASEACFQHPPCYAGEGGSIPFMSLLSKKFPGAKFLITGVLGPGSNAHGPNESLHLGYVKKLTAAVSYILCCRDGLKCRKPAGLTHIP